MGGCGPGAYDVAMAGPNGAPRTDVSWTPRDVASLDLSSLRVAIVGGTGGLGQAIARTMASRGAQVVVVGRTFRDAGTKGISFVSADLSKMKEAVRVAGELDAPHLDALVLTTGIFAGPTREDTTEGIEKDMAVSYLNRYALLGEVASTLGSARPAGAKKARVFVMGFPGAGEKGDPTDLNADRGYESMPVHMNTVAANEALVLDVAKRNPHLAVFGLNPGLIRTNIRANVLGGNTSLKFELVESVIGLLTISPEKYAARLVPLLVSPDLDALTAVMFNQKVQPIAQSPAMTDAHVAAFADASAKLLARALGTA